MQTENINKSPQGQGEATQNIAIPWKNGKWQFDKAMENIANWDEEIFVWLVSKTAKKLDAAEKNEFWRQYNEWARLIKI